MVDCIICRCQLMDTFSYRKFKNQGYPICKECYNNRISGKVAIILPKSHKGNDNKE